MSDHLAAAQGLIVSLNAPAQYHSVWIKTEVDPDTKDFKKIICVSIRPGQENNIRVPDSFQGFPVVQVPWPEGK